MDSTEICTGSAEVLFLRLIIKKAAVSADIYLPYFHVKKGV
jgi:hypothetical protein